MRSHLALMAFDGGWLVATVSATSDRVRAREIAIWLMVLRRQSEAILDTPGQKTQNLGICN